MKYANLHLLKIKPVPRGTLNNITKMITQYTKFENNGYKFSYFEKGFYFFVKPLEKGFYLLKFKVIDFINDNFFFCTDNNIGRA